MKWNEIPEKLFDMNLIQNEHDSFFSVSLSSFQRFHIICNPFIAKESMMFVSRKMKKKNNRLT